MSISKITHQFEKIIDPFLEEIDVIDDDDFLKLLITKTGTDDDNMGITTMCYEDYDKKFQLYYLDERVSTMTSEEKTNNVNIIGTNLIYRGDIHTPQMVVGNAIFLVTEYKEGLPNNEKLSSVTHDDIKNILLKRFNLNCVKISPNDNKIDTYDEITDITFSASSVMPITNKFVSFDAPSFGYNLCVYVSSEPDNNTFNKLASHFFENPVYGDVFIFNMLSTRQIGYLTKKEIIKIIEIYKRTPFKDIGKMNQIDKNYFSFRFNTNMQYNKVISLPTIEHKLSPPKVNDVAKLQLNQNSVTTQ